MSLGGEATGWSLGTGVKTGADLSTHQYKIVKFDGSGDIVVATTKASDLLLGIIQDNPPSGQACDVKCAGISKGIAGAAVTKGARLTTDGSGRAIAWSTGEVQIGIALSAAAAAGDEISVLIQIQLTA